MAGLVPAIHAFVTRNEERGCPGLRLAEEASASQAGQGPGMTELVDTLLQLTSD
jgi:hypothetical protein